MKKLIVDGYNALHALQRYSSTLNADLEQARLGLVRELSGYAVASGVEVTVVFDAHKSAGVSDEVIDGVRVVFGSRQLSADHIIERRVYEAKQSAVAPDLVVATNDRLIGNMVSSMGAAVISISTLDADLGIDYGNAAPGSPARSSRLEDRLDAESRDALERMRRNLE